MKRPGLKQRLRHAIGAFFKQRMAMSEDGEIKISGDLILLRCRGALSSSEVEMGSMKSGRLLLQEVSDRTCQELRPDLDRLVYQLTGQRLVDLYVGLFLERREKVYLLTLSDTIES